MSGLYIHIPFCKQACSYCDFYFVTRQENKQAFVEELVQEIKSKKDSQYTQEEVQSIYLGGGTPSLLSAKQVEMILEEIRRTFPINLREVTFEMNPDDVTREYLQDLKSIGITRVSMGVQSFDESLLKFMHRVHSREEALDSLEALSNSGLDSFSVDLIYGNPGQSLKTLEQDIQTLLQFSPPHVSAYALTIEPKTRLGKQFELGRLVPAEDETVAQHFDIVVEGLARDGILQYEVSNFSKSGFEAVHNSAYWNHHNYLGFGPGAHSFWKGPAPGKAQRWNNKSELKSYLNKSWKTENELEELTSKELVEERLMLGLRTTKGISRKRLKKDYETELNESQENYILTREKEGLLKSDEDAVILTQKGLKISDAIILDLITLL